VKKLLIFVTAMMYALLLTGCSSDDTLSFDITGAAKIELQSGLDGAVVDITDEADIEHITENINALKFSKDRAVDGSGWSYRLRWYDENDSMIEEIVVMSEYVIDYQDYFHKGMEADHEIDIGFYDELLEAARTEQFFYLRRRIRNEQH